jgi:raffinose/stachyose/melibiose transport system substrate-binding protein
MNGTSRPKAGITRRRLLGHAATGVALAAGASLPRIALAQASGDLSIAAISINREALEATIAAFLEQNPDVEIALSTADVDQHQTSSRIALASGTGSDVINTWLGGGNALSVKQLAPSGFLADLSDEPYADEIPESFAPLTRVDGELLILPSSLSFIGAIYNKRVFDEVGVERPTTWDGFLEVCQALKDAGVTPIASGNQTIWVNQLITYALVPSIVYAENPSFNDDRAAGNVTFAESGWAEALEKYVELSERGFLNENPVGTSFEEQLQMLASGQAAMAICVSTAFTSIFRYADHRDFAIMPLPGSNDEENLWVAASSSNGFSVNAQSENMETAKAFLRYLASPAGATVFGNAGQQAMVMPTEPNPELDALYEPVMSQYRAGKSAIYMDQTWPNPRVQEIHNTGIQRILTGQATVAEILAEMDRAYGS